MSNDPSRKLKGMSGIMIALAVIGLFVGFVLLNGARGSEESISAWTVMVSSIVFLFFSISAYFAASCVEYRNDLIREQNELLKKQEARVIKKEFEEYEAAKAEAKAKAKAARAEAEAAKKSAE